MQSFSSQPFPGLAVGRVADDPFDAGDHVPGHGLLAGQGPDLHPVRHQAGDQVAADKTVGPGDDVKRHASISLTSSGQARRRTAVKAIQIALPEALSSFRVGIGVGKVAAAGREQFSKVAGKHHSRFVAQSAQMLKIIKRGPAGPNRAGPGLPRPGLVGVSSATASRLWSLKDAMTTPAWRIMCGEVVK